MLTDPGDLVLDIFAGSNTTGAVAEREGRRWLGFELDLNYVAASAFRFIDPETPTATMREMHSRIVEGDKVDVAAQGSQLSMFEKPSQTNS
jgi:site-specific DNA-methyltransferase (cytosine-N4-specific)